MSYLFLEKYQVGTMQLKNRIVLSAMSKGLCTAHGEITESYFSYYDRMSKGGMSLITTGAMIIDDQWPSYLAGQPFITEDRHIPALKRLTDLVHQNGSYLIFQLYHPGQVQYQETVPKKIHELSLNELKSIQRKFADAARRAYEAGADGVDVHMAHTYLLSQFLSPRFNKRTDRYGCAAGNGGMTFALECIAMIRKATSPDFSITSKINGSDFAEGGITVSQAAETARLLEQAGVCMITVSAGGNLTDLTAMSADGNRMEGWKAPMAASIKEAVSIPVAVTGSIRHPWYAHHCIEAQMCDLVSLGRTFLAEPDWLHKAAKSREEDLRYCISCLHCLNDTVPGVPGCSVNPLCCLEAEYPPLVPDGGGRVVVIAGAGPAGLECALTLARRGFRVKLYEEQETVGGMMALAAVPPGKQKLNWMIDFYKRQLEKENSGIELYLNHRIEAEEILSLNPFAVILATGSRQAVPPVEGINGARVYPIRDVLSSCTCVCNRNVVIIGGGLTGLECARMYGSWGNQVTVLEMAPLQASLPLEQKLAVQYAKKANVILKYEHRVTKISDGEVFAADVSTGALLKLPYDMVITAAGTLPEQTLYHALVSRCERLHCIGDCLQTGKIVNAISDGSRTGYMLGE